jgi:parallel beta-helix repeat protein
MITYSKPQKLTKYLILIVCLVGGTITSLEQTYGQEQTTVSKGSLIVPPSLSYSYTPHAPIEIANDTDFTAPNGVSSGDGSEGNPFIIEGWNITTSDSDGIFIYNTTAHFVIRNCWINTVSGEPYGIHLRNINGTATLDTNFCQNNSWGIYLEYSDFNSLTNNTCNSNIMAGIFLEYSAFNSLTNNTCALNDNEGGGGIVLAYSDFNSFTNNTCLNNFVGIFFLEGISYNNSLTGNTCLNNMGGIVIQEAHYTSVTNNTCIFNEWDNIYVGISNYTSLINNYCSNSINGINLDYSYYCSLTNNNCSNNWYGIFLGESDSNLLRWNYLGYNGYGVFVTSGSDNNLIHHNSFIYNTNSSQAIDDGINNQWFDSSTNEGNYWSDYIGTGTYQINGSASSSDPYPLSVPPVIAEFTLLKGYFLGFVSSFVLICYIRRKSHHPHK